MCVFRTLLMVGLVVGGACMSAETDSRAPMHGVAVTLNDTLYGPGDTAQVTLVNSSDTTIVFAWACDASLEGRVEAEWILFEPDCSNVRVRPTRLAAGESTTFPLVLAPVAPDELLRYQAFRAHLRFQHDDNRGYRFARSSEFRIAPK